MRLILFVAIIGGILAIFGIVYGISFLIEKNKKSQRPKTANKAPDDDPQFLRDLARRLKEEEAAKADSADRRGTDAKPQGEQKPGIDQQGDDQQPDSEKPND